VGGLSGIESMRRAGRWADRGFRFGGLEQCAPWVSPDRNRHEGAGLPGLHDAGRRYGGASCPLYSEDPLRPSPPTLNGAGVGGFWSAATQNETRSIMCKMVAGLVKHAILPCGPPVRFGLPRPTGLDVHRGSG